MIVFLALGSNRGDRAAHLRASLADLSAAGLRVLQVSPTLETLPVAAPGRRHFLNCAVVAETSLPPRVLLRRLRQIERRHGRHGHPGGNLPRTLDIDVIFYGTECFRTRELQVPHPRYAGRRFVLIPMAVLAPQITPPGKGKTLAQLAKTLR